MFSSSSSAPPPAFFSYRCPDEALAELSPERREKIGTLRALLQTPVTSPLLRPEDDDDFHMHRFLRANEYDVDRARAMYERMVRWRADFGTDALLGGFRIEEYRRVKQDYVHFYFRTDRLGRPVYVEQLGKLNMAGIKVRAPRGARRPEPRAAGRLTPDGPRRRRP